MSVIIRGKRNITPELAVRMEDALGIKAEFWMKYQVAYEIDKIRIKNKKAVEKANIPAKTKAQMASIWSYKLPSTLNIVPLHILSRFWPKKKPKQVKNKKTNQKQSNPCTSVVPSNS